MLAATGLEALVDGVVVSAVEGVSKPDPRLVQIALSVAGQVPPEAAVLVGDSVAADVRGAQAAGVRPVLVQREGDEVRSADEDGEGAGSVQILPDLTGLVDLVLYPRQTR